MTLGLGLLPIVPVLLLPFIIILFVIVFPLWVVALGVVGLLVVLVGGLDWIARRVGLRALTPAANGIHTAFRWVLTFGGLAERPPQASSEHTNTGPAA